MRRVTALALSFCVLGCTPLAAQRIDSLAVGALVRVKLALPLSDVVRGKFLGRDSTGLLIVESSADRVPVTIALCEIRSLEVQGDARTAGQAFGRGAVWGVVAGVGIAAVLIIPTAVHESRHPCYECWLSSTAGAALLSVPLVVLSPLVGGLIGLSSRDRWVDVPIRR